MYINLEKIKTFQTAYFVCLKFHKQQFFKKEFQATQTNIKDFESKTALKNVKRNRKVSLIIR